MRMTTMLRLGLLVLVACACLRAGDPWTRGDVERQVVLETMLAIDWGQTLDIGNDPKRFHETNPLLGPHPSRATINAYMAAAMIGTYFLVDVTPRKWRGPLQTALILMELGVTTHNQYIGLRIRF